MTMEYTSLRRPIKPVEIEPPILWDRTINFFTDGVVMNAAAYCVTCLFAIVLGGILLLKYHEPTTDATFFAVIGTMVMSMAAFIVTHFNQRTLKKDQEAIAERVQMIPCKKEIDQTAARLVTSTEKIAEKVADKQTEQIKNIVENSK